MSALLIRPALMSDGSPFPFGNLWVCEAPDGRPLPELTSPQVQSLALREGWSVQPHPSA